MTEIGDKVTRDEEEGEIVGMDPEGVTVKLPSGGRAWWPNAEFKITEKEQAEEEDEDYGEAFHIINRLGMANKRTGEEKENALEEIEEEVAIGGDFNKINETQEGTFLRIIAFMREGKDLNKILRGEFPELFSAGKFRKTQ